MRNSLSLLALSNYVYDGERENNVYSGRGEETAITPFLHLSNAVVGRRTRKIHIQDKHDKRNVYDVMTAPREKHWNIKFPKENICPGKYGNKNWKCSTEKEVNNHFLHVNLWQIMCSSFGLYVSHSGCHNSNPSF